MASTMTAIQTVTVGSGGAASVTFSAIPQTYNDLVVKWSARSAGSAGPIETFITLNGQTPLVYDQVNLSGFDSGVYSAKTTNWYGFTIQYATGNTSTANTFSNNEICIPDYASTTKFKSISFESVSEKNATTDYILGPSNASWSKTDAITSMTIQSNGAGDWLEYSTFTLYGVYNSALDTQVEAPTIGTPTAASSGANVVFTPSATGAPATSYIATSSPGDITATGSSSPILVTGLTIGTAYTFTVKGQNPGGAGLSSAASSSVTPYAGYESIATLYPSGATTGTFSSIPSTFQHLQIRVLSRSARTGSSADELFMTINSTSLTKNHYLLGTGSSALSGSATAGWVGISTAASATANIFGTSVIDILDYTDTNKNKTIRSLSGFDSNGGGEIYLLSNFINSTTAISTLAFTCSGSNTFASGTIIELYGIRG
jgi:hypothetical protein